MKSRSPPLLFVVVIKSHWLRRISLLHTQVGWTFLSSERWSVHSILDLLALLCLSLFLTELAPGGDSFLPVLLPSFHVLLDNLLSCCLLLLLVSLLPLVSCIKSLEVMLAFFNLLEELLAHVLDLHVELLFGKRLQTDSSSALVLLSARAIDSFFGLTHHTLVHSSLLRIHQSFVGLLQQMEGIGSFFVTALIRMHHQGEHAELPLDLRFTRLGSNFKDIVWVDEGVVKQPI